jgi:DNA-binding CsgD family transcriptional regulator
MTEPTTSSCDPTPAGRRGAAGHSGELLAEAIEAIGFGIVLVTKDGFITFANTMARELMRRGEGMRSSSGWLAATSAEVTTRLRNLLKFGSKAASNGANGAAPSAATIILERGEGRQALFAHVMALNRGGDANRQDASAAAVVFIIDPELYALPSFEAFATLYGLTRAEARVLQEIIGGKGLVAAAGKLRVSEATARTHMQRIFDKTGTKRQTELLCLFFKATLPGQIGDR